MTLRIVKTVNNIREFNSFNRIKHVRTLETITTLEEQIKRIKDKNLKLIQGEQLYKHSIFDFKIKYMKDMMRCKYAALLIIQ